MRSVGKGRRDAAVPGGILDVSQEVPCSRSPVMPSYIALLRKDPDSDYGSSS